MPAAFLEPSMRYYEVMQLNTRYWRFYSPAAICVSTHAFQREENANYYYVGCN